MMKAYISVSYKNRKLMINELNAIVDTLKDLKIVPFIFVDNYLFDNKQEKEMMKQAMADIDECDMLIAETSDKAIGIGVEAGYAKARQKPVIYLRKKEAEHSTTVSGISDFQIIYEDCNDLEEKLFLTIKEIIETHREFQ